MRSLVAAFLVLLVSAAQAQVLPTPGPGLATGGVSEAIRRLPGPDAAPVSGGNSLQKIATVTTTSGQAAIQFQSLGAYSNFRMLCFGVSISAVDYFILQFGTGAGPTYDTTGANYIWNSTLIADGTTPGSESQTTLPQNGIGVVGYPTTPVQGSSQATGSIDMALYGLPGSVTKNVTYKSYGHWTDYFNISFGGGGAYLSSTPVTAIQLLPGGGTINAGVSCTLYGEQT
jgi:hypothetical protein